jgi:hypothetical protein
MARPQFRQSDLQKALKAARAAGFEAGEVRIIGGEIRILARSVAVNSDDVLDEINRWAAHGKG